MAEDGNDNHTSYGWAARTYCDQDSEGKKKGELLRGNKEKKAEIIQEYWSIDVDLEGVGMGSPARADTSTTGILLKNG
jgi:hypothetical protein